MLKNFQTILAIGFAMLISACGTTPYTATAGIQYVPVGTYASPTPTSTYYAPPSSTYEYQNAMPRLVKNSSNVGARIQRGLLTLDNVQNYAVTMTESNGNNLGTQTSSTYSASVNIPNNKYSELRIEDDGANRIRITGTLGNGQYSYDYEQNQPGNGTSNPVTGNAMPRLVRTPTFVGARLKSGLLTLENIQNYTITLFESNGSTVSTQYSANYNMSLNVPSNRYSEMRVEEDGSNRIRVTGVLGNGQYSFDADQYLPTSTLCTNNIGSGCGNYSAQNAMPRLVKNSYSVGARLKSGQLTLENVSNYNITFTENNGAAVSNQYSSSYSFNVPIVSNRFSEITINDDGTNRIRINGTLGTGQYTYDADQYYPPNNSNAQPCIQLYGYNCNNNTYNPNCTSGSYNCNGDVQRYPGNQVLLTASDANVTGGITKNIEAIVTLFFSRSGDGWNVAFNNAQGYEWIFAKWYRNPTTGQLSYLSSTRQGATPSFSKVFDDGNRTVEWRVDILPLGTNANPGGKLVYMYQIVQ